VGVKGEGLNCVSLSGEVQRGSFLLAFVASFHLGWVSIHAVKIKPLLKEILSYSQNEADRPVLKHGPRRLSL